MAESLEITDPILREFLKYALKLHPVCELPTDLNDDNMSTKQIKEEAQRRERAWGNQIIGQQDNTQWTTKAGEHSVKKVLELLGQNPRSPETKDNYRPDWECDDYMVEVKTKNYHTCGTASEKVLGTFIKYRNIPELYGKPLKIIVVAEQEWTMISGKTPYFGDRVDEKTKQVLDLAKSWGIEYVRFSDLISPLSYE